LTKEQLGNLTAAMAQLDNYTDSDYGLWSTYLDDRYDADRSCGRCCLDCRRQPHLNTNLWAIWLVKQVERFKATAGDATGAVVSALEKERRLGGLIILKLREDHSC